MRKLGLIGGTSWRSSIEYYQAINEGVNTHFGNNTNPPIILYTLNQAQIHKYQNEDNWDEIAQLFIDAALDLEKTRVEAVMFCANTPHKVYDTVNESIHVPILHIADATAKSIQKHGLSKVGFIGTKFTMREPYLVDRIARSNIEVLVPENLQAIEELQRIIREELTYGIIKESSKKIVLEEIKSMITLGAQGVVLGCTEFPLMISENDVSIPVFNTTKIHSETAIDFVLNHSEESNFDRK